MSGQDCIVETRRLRDESSGETVTIDVESSMMTDALMTRASLTTRAAILTIGIWIAVSGLILLPLPVTGTPLTAALALNVVTAAMLGLAASAGLFVLARSVQPQRPLFRYGWLTMGVLFSALVLALVDASKDAVLRRTLQPDAPPIRIELQTSTNLLVFSLILAMIAAMYSVLIDQEALARRERELADARQAAAEAKLAATQAQAAATGARLDALRYQLNPHFLFNTLNGISSLVMSERRDDAEGMIAKLSQYLRLTLTTRADPMLSLEDELALITNYLEIESFRFRDRLTVEIDCPSSLLSLRVPSLLLQPLVENAIKHGVAPTSRPVTLSIAVRTEGDVVAITVCDDGGGAGSKPVLENGLGLGLENVRQRLLFAYGEKAGVTAAPLSPGYRVTLRAPLSSVAAQAA